MTLRRALVLILLGLVFGAAIGVAFAYIQRSQREADQAAAPLPTPGSWMLTCSDGKTPTVRITWDGKLTSAMATLERSSDGTSWTRVFPEGEPPKASGYTDSSVVANTQYYYRYRLKEDDEYTQASVSTDPDSCI